MNVFKKLFGGGKPPPAEGPVTPRQVELVQTTWAAVVPIADTAADLFYGKLFELDPELRPLFKEDISEQKGKLMKTIGVAVNGLNDLGAIVPVVQELGRKHVGYGVTAPMYDTVGAALLWTLEQGLGEQWNDEVKGAWVAVYTVLATTMKEAAATASGTAPTEPEGPSVTPEQIAMVQGTWAKVVPIADVAADLFYGKLFELDPELKVLFPEEMAAQKAKLMKTIGVAVNGLTDLEVTVPVVQDLGRRHAAYQVTPAMYGTVAEALLWTLEQGLKDDFTPEVKAAWTAVYTLLAKTMIDAAEEVAA